MIIVECVVVKFKFRLGSGLSCQILLLVRGLCVSAGNFSRTDAKKNGYRSKAILQPLKSHFWTLWISIPTGADLRNYWQSFESTLTSDCVAKSNEAAVFGDLGVFFAIRVKRSGMCLFTSR